MRAWPVVGFGLTRPGWRASGIHWRRRNQRRAALLFGLLLTACATVQRPATPLPPQTALERSVAAAGLEAWREAGLATTPMARWLDQLRIERPATIDAYDQRCPADALGESWACLRWYAWDVPVAVLSPLLADEQVGRAALHELCHAMGYRFGRWPDYDSPGHADTVVWGPDGVEKRAQRILDGPDLRARVAPAPVPDS